MSSAIGESDGVDNHHNGHDDGGGDLGDGGDRALGSYMSDKRAASGTRTWERHAERGSGNNGNK